MNILYIVIAIISLLILYFLSGFCFALVARKKSSKVDKELDKLVDFEIERGKVVLKEINILKSNNFKFDEETYKFIKSAIDNFSKLNTKERATYKNTIDFVALYLVKIYSEDPKFGKMIPNDLASEFKEYQKISDEKYKIYNKKAGSYNALLFMPFTKTALKILKADPNMKQVF